MKKDSSLSKKIFDGVKTYAGMTFGMLIYTFALAAFIIPSQLISGGFTGLGMILFYVTGIPVGITNFVANVILLIIAFRLMGWKFVKMSLIGVTMSSVLLVIFQKFITEPLVAGEPFMNALLGGAISGVGLGIVFNFGGNTGGTDIIALIINKYRNISPGRIGMYFNAIVVILFFVVFRDIEKVVFGLIVMWTFAYVLDVTLNGNRQSYQFMIISPKYAEIANAIANDIGRGVTVIPAIGWYNKSDTEVLFIIVHRQDKVKILKLVKEIDPQAFMAVTRVEGVYGRNFEKIKI
ncbi:YitT family protein [Odoribacter sp. OttesenSCG-928-L07]|nr:YitT family protein [Odoribacter sp. OttesenSCG-928-L07]